MLLWIHGGPEEQHRPAFDPLLQFFVVERGIAVVAPNIRGSVGYGRRYLGLDDGIKRADAIKDIGALLDWIASRPEFDADRVGIIQEVRAVLEQFSPLTNADQIKVPLLVGANDPRVPVSEAEQIVSAVREQGVEVWYMLARDEGHGFRKRRSRDLFYSVMAAFSDAHLVRGARVADPIGE